jgi:dTMP kinase
MDDGLAVPIWADLKTALRGDSSKRRRMAGGGVFIAFEGGEGSGKSTQIGLLADGLRDAGIDVVVTQEPGATGVGRRIRDLLLHDDEALAPRAEALLFAADRAHHVATIIQPALDRGDVVITDRYIDSSMAYQGAGRELTFEEVRRLSGWATCGLTPDLTVLLDIPAAVGLERAHGRAESTNGRRYSDKLERESLEFHGRVRTAFRGLAEAAPGRYLLLDAMRPTSELASEILATVEGLLASRRPRSFDSRRSVILPRASRPVSSQPAPERETGQRNPAQG